MGYLECQHGSSKAGLSSCASQQDLFPAAGETSASECHTKRTVDNAWEAEQPGL